MSINGPIVPNISGLYTPPSPTNLPGQGHAAAGAVPGAGIAAAGMSGPATLMPPPGTPANEFELTPRTYWQTTMFSRRYRDHERDAAGIIQHLFDIKAGETKNIASDIAPSMKSKDGLFESKFDLFEKSTHEGLRRLVAFIESSVRRAVWHVNGREVDPKRIKVNFSDSWFHITNNSGFHDAHYHGGCSWCGVYYLQISDVPEDPRDHAPNGVNRFYTPRPFGGNHSDYGNHYLGQGHVDVPPMPGTLVLFPAYLLHSGLPYKGVKDRVILSFNSTSTLLPEGQTA